MKFVVFISLVCHLLLFFISKIEKNLVWVGPVLQIVLYPQIHIRVEEYVLGLFLHHIASLLAKATHCTKYADSWAYVIQIELVLLNLLSEGSLIRSYFLHTISSGPRKALQFFYCLYH